MTIEQIIAGELSVRPQQAAATLELLDSGNTIPFIARYRKEVTGSLDEEQIRMISERAQYLRNLEERRQEILESITSQEKLTPELERCDKPNGQAWQRGNRHPYGKTAAQ